MSWIQKNEISRWQNKPIRKNKRMNKGKGPKTPLLLFLTIGFLFVTLLCLYCWQTIKMLEYSYKIENTKKLISELEEKHRRLEIEEAFVLSPALIHERAMRKLGMTAPKPGQLLFESDLMSAQEQAIAMALPADGAKNPNKVLTN